ncbi:glycosyltransferase involved in cell wall biosynthesis [Breznakia blatticola]|uniref:Glycosyltransferase involved in cell wall biosynthesis n=1 Tax=Breznakia blatticola TaxID=1754012 RepID=A0A4R7Z941_9FIRM|nr:glycosyltransferase family 2 protein [Breznakia blatticola]TDW13957.1 glycosyltransferase involved in cell wall biosynthesis [Breznakia blatticola]
MNDVSVIIPVYNAELYIARCVDSLLNQKTQYSYEIICVDDGSTDNSAQILMKYNGMIRVILSENNGPGHARNLAVNNSNSTYLMFVDADDYVSDDFIEMHMTALKETNSDICISDFYRVTQDKKKYVSKGKYKIYLKGQFQEVLLMEFHSVNKAIKRSVFINYPENIFFEDMVAMSESILNANKIVKIEKAGYYYNCVENSTTNTLSDKIYDIYYATMMMEPSFVRNGYSQEIEYLFVNGILVDLCIKLIKAKGIKAKQEVYEYLNEVSIKYPRWYRNKYVKDTRFMKRIYLFLLRKHLFLIVMLVFRRKK